MLTGATRAEVINNRLKRRERRGAVSPDISAVSFLLSGRKHLHWSFVGMPVAFPDQHAPARQPLLLIVVKSV